MAELCRRLRRAALDAEVVFDVCEEVAGAAWFPVEGFEEEDLVPVLESAVVAAGRARVTVDFRAKSYGSPLPDALVSLLGLEAGDGAREGQGFPVKMYFDRLSVEARATCLRLVPGAFARQMDEMQSLIAGDNQLSFEDEQDLVRAAAHAAARDLNLHWHVVDSLRDEIMAESGEPFTPRHWLNRRLYRALHACMSTEISVVRNGGSIDASGLLEVSPLHRRFFPHLRPVVSVLESFGSSLQPSTAGIFALHDALMSTSAPRCKNPSAPLFLSPDVHVVVLVLEFHMQRILSCAAMSLAGTTGSDYTQEEYNKALGVLARVICAVGVTRERGGVLVETSDQWNARCARACRHLARLIPGGGRPTSRIRASSFWNTLKLGDGLVAAIVVGCCADVDGASYPADGHLAAEVAWMCEMVTSNQLSTRALERDGVLELFHGALDRLIETSGSVSIAKGRPALIEGLLARRAKWDSRGCLTNEL